MSGNVWESTGKYLGQWAPPVFLNVTPELVHNPEKLVKYLEKICCCLANSRETQTTATCWGLAHAYGALFSTIQYLQEEERENRLIGVGDTPTLMTRTATTSTPATGTVATPTPVTNTAVLKPLQQAL